MLGELLGDREGDGGEKKGGQKQGRERKRNKLGKSAQITVWA